MLGLLIHGLIGKPNFITIFSFTILTLHSMGLAGNSQGSIELCILLLNYISAHWYNDAIQHRAQFWRSSCHDLWMVRCRVLHHAGWSLYGRDLLIVPNFRWTLLLECQALWEGLSTLCILDDWMVHS